MGPVVTNSCPACKADFVATRKGKRFCSRKCQKRTSQNAARGPRTNRASPTSRKRNEAHYSLSHSLCEGFYKTPPQHRLGFLKDLVDRARQPASQYDKAIKNVLTHKQLTYPDRQDRSLFYRGQPFTYCTISELVNRYCKKLLGASSKTVLTSPNFKENTGEILE